MYLNEKLNQDAELIIEGTNGFPFVNFNRRKGELTMGGTSLPENVKEAYLPIFEWIDNYKEDPQVKDQGGLLF
ncbi:MAG: DUF1987 domain-containing protein [Bacteroidales bacterium]|nr:DUF1987 domain-containing protein [Bacteroidales bacterium]